MMRRYCVVVGVVGVFWFVVGACVAGASQTDSALDANHDGKISRQEALTAQKRRFKRMDRDGNGQVSPAEFEKAFRRKQSTDGQTPDQRRQRLRRLHRWFDQLDRDDSNTISEDEFQSAMTPYFDRLDANHDGQIEPNELRRRAPTRSRRGNNR